ncbi:MULTISPECIES: DegT/DnrJ/EryC1/StrS family aminotransferase [Curtobacterium]|uniref:DegT/DnrJ/EryC1/StrS family aminotransferase n=1 Tax=Curtobacterium TaxID=2034 RepID=UPI000DAAA756|nr:MULTISPECIES: DegT/DnrJ/EryC1/StrS family aminotransferase [Curtobacterium]MBO9050203.1 DegT/DnrJ/EryC1/StrS family aminotransferase [Curtobacterium flaccumfaciens pv. flaccumfaciens]MCS6550254.1 DegT/DnrJ/EryC1/StrS family aminotransferase [Curtobacterium flaccumfaciens pv. flaccumfaciens]WIE58516.1 DegT/DnrJ/EryC1/StrS family aminotransferase [Curtobacterium sp. MCLR17_031]
MTTTLELIPAAKPLIGLEERRAVDAVLEGGGLAQGPEVAAFEREFGDVLVAGASVTAVNSGTAALHLALVALGLGPGDEVIVPSFTFAATANAVRLVGAEPVFVDIDPLTYCVDPSAVRAAVTPATRAIMPVHLYGHPADMTAIARIAEEHELLVVEDAAQAHGARWAGARVGSSSDAAAFSLYPTKNMTAGEGGMVSTRDAAVDRMLRLLRNQGMEQRYANEVIGFNARMTDIHAAIGRVQLRKVLGWTAQRQANAAYFSRELDGVVTPTTDPRAEHVFHQYVVRVPSDRDGFAAALRSEFGIGTGVYYPTPVHRLPSFAHDLDLPETERAASEVLALPVYPTLTLSQLDRVVEAVNTLAGAGR